MVVASIPIDGDAHLEQTAVICSVYLPAESFPMADIKSPTLLYLKGFLMLAVGVLAAGLLIAEHANLKTTILLAVSIWGFCRAYYFAFYVIEHYIDPGYRYAGLVAFFRHWLSRHSPK